MDDELIPRLPVNTETFKFNGWNIIYTKSHILKSICTNDNNCVFGDPQCCELCVYVKTLELPHLPDMVFPKNSLTLEHDNGVKLEFNPMDALKCVQNTKNNNIKVACADEWQESRPAEHMEEKIKPFDWTFTTNYQGTLNDKVIVQDTNEKLNTFKLMKKEKILFYNDLLLFEDELHDHGIAMCSVKLRVMPSGFYILLRFFLRIDNVMIRINDTRFHYEIENNYILKEYTSKESKVEDLKHVPPAIFTVPSEIENHLTVTEKIEQKLLFKGDEINVDGLKNSIEEVN